MDWRFSVFEPYKNLIKEFNVDGYFEYHKRNNDYLEFVLVRTSMAEIKIILSFSWTTDKMRIEIKRKILAPECSFSNKTYFAKDVNKFLELIREEYNNYLN